MAAFGAAIGTGVGTSPATTWNITTTAAVPSGGKVLVWIGWFNATATTAAVSGGGLTWTTAANFVSGSYRCSICWADAPAGLASSSTLTATITGGGSSFSCASGACYATGCATGAPEATAQNNGTGTAHSAAITTLSAGAFVFYGSWHDFNLTTSTATGPSVEIQDWQNAADGTTATTIYRIGGAAGSHTVAGTWAAGPTDAWVSGVASFPDGVVAAVARGTLFNPIPFM